MMLTFVGYLLFLALPITGLLLFSCLFEYNNIGKVKITLTKVLGSIVDTLSILGIIITVIKYGGIYTYNDTVGKIISIGYKGISVEYNGEYGKETQQIDINISENIKNYKEEDTVTIQITCCVFLTEPINFSVIPNEE